MFSGDECRPLGGGQGTCTLLSQCQTLGDFKKNRPPICAFKNLEPIVCCPTKLTSKVNQGHKAEQLCKVLDLRCRNSLDLTKNVVGGKESASRTHIFMVLIGYGETEKDWRCAGSLITARYVMSAAHCSNLHIMLGELDISSSSDDAKPVDKAIIERIPHPKYIPSQNYHDIALFKLDSDVVFNNYVLPICLHTKRQITSKVATVIGWGKTGFIDATSEKLLEADLEVYNDTECKRLMFSSITPQTPRGHEADQMICAGVPDGSKDACQGDSGGPLVVRDIGKCIRTQLGVISFGKECGNPNSPGVYTRVSNYIYWIEEVAFGDGMIF
ncbi:unnamed protein product [Nezara viridula]|uniref:Uncharacterized protein n=1 Tax=Nezara viridula TaxID=85310 RepID=A0A9P0HPK2_NEZVI|nr:unnamed protein product [Nezara viridula]